MPSTQTQPSKPMYYARAITSIGWLELVQSLGHDPDKLLAQVGLNRQLMSDPDNMVPYLAIAQLMELSAEQTGHSNFALLMARSWPSLSQVEGPLGILTELMLHSPTIGDAWECFCQHYHLHSQGVAWSLKWDQKYAYIHREGLLASHTSTLQSATANLAHILVSMRYLYDDESWTPSFVSFNHDKPAQHQDYERYFGCPVHFGQELNCLAFPVAELKNKIRYSNDKLEQLLKAKLKQIETQNPSEQSFTTQLELLIRQGLRNGNCQQTLIAQQLLLHPKKLQRELKARNIGFRAMRAKIRLDLAEHFIKDTDIPLTAIADMLGYSALSALSRAFAQRHGCSAHSWRKKHMSTQVKQLST